MPTHTVRQGDCFSSIARQYGFASWKAIYDHPDNAELKKKRPNPNLIHPGDRIVVPDKAEKQIDCAAGEKHRFQVKLPRTKLRVVLKDHDEQPYAGKKYKLVIGNQTLEGTTDGQGLVDQRIEGDVAEGVLTLFLDDKRSLSMKLRVGHLDPGSEISGAQARLANLGYDAGPVDGEMSPKLSAALKRFQKKMGLTESGALDDDTRGRLESAHDEQ